MGLDMELRMVWTVTDDDGDEWECTDYGFEWRKANAIHGWFVSNVCGGTCENNVWYGVSREQLAELGRTCRRVLDGSKMAIRTVTGLNGRPMELRYIEDTELAESLMPTKSGFFFGSTEYGFMYIQDLERTARAVEELLDETPPQVTFEYMASW